ncbi:MAG: type II toxin-antitoxin system RelE/ParE family toxin [Bacteroidota bacterium]
MPELKIRYLLIAQKDLLEIMAYIRRDNPAAALDLLDRFDEAVSRLGEFPYLGSVPKDHRLRLLGYRILIVGNYLVFYVVIDDAVEIRRVLHGKRRYEFLL